MDDMVARSFDFMEHFPVLDDLVICRNISAHDKKGGNDNGFTQKAEYIRREKGRTTVLLDAVGPGCVFHYASFWLNHLRLVPKFLERIHLRLLGRVNFYFDRENTPRIRKPLNEFVGLPPFAYPLALTAEQSTGTTLSYVPLPFQEGLKVTVDGGKTPSFGLHFWYHCYPPGTKLASWTENQDVAEAADHFRPETAWQPAGSIAHELKGVSIPPRQAVSLFETDRGGTIKCLRMRLPRDDNALRNLWLKAWWDNDETPSIEAPLSLLYAVENRFAREKRTINENASMRGAIIGQAPDGLFFLRLPMPFARQARLVLENRGEAAVTLPEIKVEADARTTPGLGSTAGYLRTEFRQSHQLIPGRDYLLADIEGRGKIAGTVLAVENTHENFLEGDERIYTDGGRSPLIIGDATETYFNGSWYFCEMAFACPIHGAPTFRMKGRLAGGISDVTMYRFHPTDYVPFRSGARFSIQHGGFNEVSGHYRSLVFYYHLPAPSLQKSDFLSLDNPDHLEEHAFSGPPPLKLETRDGFFEGELNGQDIGLKKRPRWVLPFWWMFYWTLIAGNFRRPPQDSPDRVCFTVASHDRPHSFTVKIDPEADAVMLRRVLDQSVFDQRARIEVDGQAAATWFNTGNNPWKIFAEDDIILDPATTRSKGEITIFIVPESTVWTAAQYSVFSIKTMEPREPLQGSRG